MIAERWRRVIGKGIGLSAGLWMLVSPMAVAADTPQPGGTLRVVFGVETQTLFAPGGGGGNPLLVSTKILERLVRLEDDLSISGQLAESWSVSDDSRTYSFALRPNASWHDGTPFTAEDVVFNAMEHWRAFAGNPALRSIESAEATGPHSVDITFAAPVPEFLVLASLGGTETQVIPRHLYEGTDLRENPLNNTPVGTGPFRYVEWVRGSHVELARNDAYWEEGLPYLDRIFIRYLQEPSARANAFEVGEVELGVGSPFPPADMTRFAGTGRHDVTERGGLQEFMVMEMNTRNPILADNRVRQAIAYALDRQFVVDVLMNGFGRKAMGPVSDIFTRYFNPDLPAYDHNPDRARALLDEAGHPQQGNAPRFSLRLVIGPWYPENTRMGSYVQQALEEVGIAVQVVTPDRGGAIAQIYREYAFDLSISNNVSYVDPLMRSVMLYTTDNITGTPFRNASGYSNPEMDRVVEAAAVETDEARRLALLHEFQAIALEDLPVLVVAFRHNMTLAQPKVRNHSIRPEWMYDTWKDLWLAQ